MDRDRLAVYLNDHLAGSSFGSELAGRLANRWPDGDLGEFLERVALDVEEDRATLKRIMGQFGIDESQVKQAAAWAAEKASRLKPNLSLAEKTPLSKLIDLEAMRLGVEGKLALWRSLEAARIDPVVADLGDLIERAISQRNGLERYRLEAAAELLS
jgi:hypothetical protein